jgi:hypothetical protein
MHLHHGLLVVRAGSPEVSVRKLIQVEDTVRIGMKYLE